MPHAWSRRNFLQRTTAAAGAVFLGRTLAARAAQGKAAQNRFLIGLQSYTLRNFPVEKVLELTEGLGLGSIEFFNAHFKFDSPPDVIAAIRKNAADRGIKILGHGVDPYTKDHAANRRYFEFAKQAGIRNLSADPTEDSFDSLDKLVEEYQIRIAIHNHGPGARYDKIADVLTAIKGHHPLIGACADLGHYIRSGEDPVRAIHLFKGRLYGVHLKDFAEQKAKTQGVILGKGHLDVDGVFEALRKVDFPADGCLSLEYEEKPNDPIDDVKQCLAIAFESARKASA